jgi:alpha-N-arabinofuranosidase
MTRRPIPTLTVLATAIAFGPGFAGPAMAAAEPPAARPNLLQNAGFEQFAEGADLPAAYTKAIYGAAPTIRPDAATSAEGKQSLQISATEPSDTAIAQDVALTPGHVYRFSGSVRTKDLAPDGASSTYGTFQIQDPAGQTLARMKNHRGTTDWTRESVSFRAPADGKVHVVCFLVGFGKGTGTAWFDDLRLEEAPGGDTLVVTANKLQNEPISPFIYGNFVELLSDLVPSMWAEMLDVTSFEFLRTPQERKLREPHFVQDPTRDPKDRPWRPLGGPATAKVDIDSDNPFNGAESQRIELKAGGTQAGIWQDGIAVEKGEKYHFIGHFRARDFKGPVFIEVHRGDSLLASERIADLGADWQRKEVTLQANATAPYARFVLRIAAPGTIWVDRVSLVPVKNVSGWRADVVEALKAMKPGLLRWGGSLTEWYDWKKGIGPWEQRVPFPDPYWGRVHPNLVGIDEFVALCQAVEAEPLICVRWSDRKPSDAADLVQYCNGASDTPMGSWRVSNGHPKPYGVKYWQIGNEVSGKEYDATIADFARAMRQADPSITLLAAFASEATLKNAGDLIDYASPHPYDVGNLEGTVAFLEDYGEMLKRTVPNRDIKIAATEWNTTAGDWGTPGRTRMVTLGNALACARFLHFCQRHSELMKICCRSNISNSYYSGIIQTNNRSVLGTPAYWVSRLYARHGGKWPLALGNDTATLLTDATAALSDDGRTLTLSMINTQAEPVDQAIDLSAFRQVTKQANVWTVADCADAGDPDVMNTFDRPDRIAITAGRFDRAATRFTYRLPALSVTLLELEVSQ